ncbi:MAG: maleylpyruvate isomerase family mycothiol-dependent enzyme [Humibacillus sp.]|nr:maleylpyruvate isomerase family mycothiol-dependent enzyme [Humibacillus sp.]MDN5775958.1 maleylpyruvate isomerase family mycothiol-dependent enzyme [Humibacillus sp.]
MRQPDTAVITLEHIEAETERVVATAGSLHNDAVLAPSLCAGWSRGHVLSHLARNAEALERVCAAAAFGTGQTMYESDEVRDAEVAAGARRSASVLADDVRVTAEQLAGALASLGPQHASMTVPRTPGGRLITIGSLRFLRLRELVFHHVDLDTGYGFEQLAPPLAQLFLDDAVTRLVAQRASSDPDPLELETEEGSTYVIAPVRPERPASVRVAGTRAAMLLWLTRGIDRGLTSNAPLPDLPNGG